MVEQNQTVVCENIVRMNFAKHACYSRKYNVSGEWYSTNEGAMCLACLNTDLDCVEILMTRHDDYAPTYYDKLKSSVYHDQRELFLVRVPFTDNDMLWSVALLVFAVTMFVGILVAIWFVESGFSCRCCCYKEKVNSENPSQP